VILAAYLPATTEPSVCQLFNSAACKRPLSLVLTHSMTEYSGQTVGSNGWVQRLGPTVGSTAVFCNALAADSWVGPGCCLHGGTGCIGVLHTSCCHTVLSVWNIDFPIFFLFIQILMFPTDAKGVLLPVNLRLPSGTYSAVIQRVQGCSNWVIVARTG
jgi:hypothetical protein